MRRIYSILRPPIESKSYIEWINKCDQKISVSSRGLAAFTSSFCLNQSKPSSTSYHVYVADLNAPYQPYLVVDSAYDFTIIEWDPSGTKLLICDVRGSATIYTSKDYLVSDWKLYFQQVFAAETFLSATWYHLGLITSINVANQDLKTASNHLEYSDKIQQNKFGTSLRLFGGKPAEGCVLVSRTGLICCLTLLADGCVDVVYESLLHLRQKIEVADICHNKDGSFIIATSAGSINSTIAFYQVSLHMKNLTLEEVDNNSSYHIPTSNLLPELLSLQQQQQQQRRVSIICKQFHSFHLNIMSQILNERENNGNSTTSSSLTSNQSNKSSQAAFEKVSHIKFVTKDCPDDVLIEVSGQNLSLIELWELEPMKKAPIHSAILELIKSKEDIKPTIDQTTGKVVDDFGLSKEWSFKGNYITDKELVTIQTPKFKLFGPNRQLNLILLAYKDSTVCCMRKEDLQLIEEPLHLFTPSNNSNNLNKPDLHSSLYKNNLIKNQNKSTTVNHMNAPRATCITDIQVTTNQSVFVAIDSLSQIHTIELPPLVPCQDGKDYETYLQYLLEYCLITGNDWWDVLVCIKDHSIDSICDKFHDAYERQPKHMQRKYFNKQLMIRASLYRCRNNVPSLCKASDCHTTIMLNSISSTIKSLIRSQQEQDSPAEYLTNFLKTQQPQILDLNTVISKLNEKDFFIELNLIQCLQPLSQWVVDLAIFLIVSSPHRLNYRIHLPGAGLASNKEALELLRELIIIIKIWSLQNEISMPVINKLTEQIDVYNSLFKLISILHNYATFGQNNQKLGDSFFDECNQLANSISVPEFNFSLTSIGIASPLLHEQRLSASGQSLLKLEFFKIPAMPELVKLPQVEASLNMNGQRKIDVIRNISLGAYPTSNLKHCTRCKSVSLIKPVMYQTSRSWEQRWINSCVCGGSWAQSDGTFKNKVAYALWSYHNSSIAPYNHNHHHHQLVR